MFLAQVLSQSPTVRPLQIVYFVRGVFAVVWGLALIGVRTQPAFTLILFTIYFAVDAASVLFDAYIHRASKSIMAQIINGIISLLAVVAALVVAPMGIPALFGVFGIWAIVTGGLAFVVALRRRRAYGGQGVLLFSSGGAVLSGITFVLLASRPTLFLFLVGYAVGGGVEFIISALRLGKQAHH